jgi:hypothetical protein
MSNTQARLAPDIVGGLIDGGASVPMHHPDGGCCDLYGTDTDGRLIVPAIEVPAMIEHGFLVAGDAA